MAKPMSGYLAVVLDEASQAFLKGMLGDTSFEHTPCHHATLMLKPSAESAEALVGMKVEVKTSVRYEDHNGIAVTVELPSIFGVGVDHPHVTLAHTATVGAKYSKELIRSPLAERQVLTPEVLNGAIEFIHF